MANLAVIPARGGSKRIPRKNVKSFAGMPMIVHAIKAAQESGCFDAIVVSTDDDEIAGIAAAHGAEVPFRRPEELSDDHTGTSPVVRHAIESLAFHGRVYENTCCIYATAPFLTSDYLQNALKTLQTSDASYVFSVGSFPYPIQRALRLNADGRVEKFSTEQFNSRSQDLEEAYHDAGQFYWGKTRAWLEKVGVFQTTSIPFLLPRHRVQDIDTPEDWDRAELMYLALQQSGTRCE
ncbi:MAG: pseudaminic acid cytidylyltransferase [Idiomarina sp.]|nr:pseudaminic acid cytidylyltransferase [Idiomarina sp.]